MRNTHISELKDLALNIWLPVKFAIAIVILLFSSFKLFYSFAGYFVSNLSQDVISDYLATTTVHFTFILFAIFVLISTMHQFKIIRKY